MKFRKLFSVFILTSLIYQSYSQNTEKSFFTPYKIGILYNTANEKNFLFDDPDYYYSTNTIKGQLFYKLGKFIGLDIELIAQPQVQFIKHQLFNEQFVRPEDPDHLRKRAEFTKLKSINIYALEFGISAYKQLIKKLKLRITGSLGFAFINTETERLAKGFTFIENGSIGLEFQTTKKTFLYLGGNIGHVSNFDFIQPNSGYDILGVEFGFSYKL